MSGQAVRKGVALSPGIARGPAFVLGRIAEHLGYRDLAKTYYGKIEKPEKPHFTATYELAKRRLAKL